MMVCSFEKHGRLFNVLPYYRPHTYKIDDFLPDLETFLSTTKLNGTTYFLGDLNVDFMNQCSSDSLRYLELLSGFGFKSLINSPTRETESTSSCIDHVFVSNSVARVVIKPIILKTHITDHYTTLAIQTLSNPGYCNSQEKFRRCINYEKLKNDLMHVSWDEFYDTADVARKADIFIETVTSCVSAATTLKATKIQKRKQPSITIGSIKSIRTRDRLFQRFIKTKSNEARDSYRAYGNKLNSLLGGKIFLL